MEMHKDAGIFSSSTQVDRQPGYILSTADKQMLPDVRFIEYLIYTRSYTGCAKSWLTTERKVRLCSCEGKSPLTFSSAMYRWGDIEEIGCSQCGTSLEALGAELGAALIGCWRIFRFLVYGASDKKMLGDFSLQNFSIYASITLSKRVLGHRVYL